MQLHRNNSDETAAFMSSVRVEAYQMVSSLKVQFLTASIGKTYDKIKTGTSLDVEQHNLLARPMLRPEVYRSLAGIACCSDFLAFEKESPVYTVQFDGFLYHPPIRILPIRVDFYMEGPIDDVYPSARRQLLYEKSIYF